jgi:creatinine amidohydrolase
MQSLGMYLFPEDVRPDLMEAGNPPVWNGQRVQGTSTVYVDGQPVHLYLNYEEITANGVLGDPRLGSAEAGRRLVEHMVAVGARVVEWFRGVDTRG